MKNLVLISILSLTVFSCKNETPITIVNDKEKNLQSEIEKINIESNLQKEQVNELNVVIKDLKQEVYLLKDRLNKLPPIVGIGEVKILNVKLTSIYHGDMSEYVYFIDLKSGIEYHFAFWSWTVEDSDIFSFSEEYTNNRGGHFNIKIEYQIIEEMKDGTYSEYFGKADVKTGNLISIWVLTEINSIN